MSNNLSPDQSVAVGAVSLHVPVQYGYLRLLRQAVLDVCARAGFSEIQSAQMEMAVDEAAANIIEHSYREQRKAGNENLEQSPGLQVKVMQEADRVIIELVDFGDGFDWENHEITEPEKYIDRNQNRGLGMYIIQQFVDEVEYQRNGPGEGNRLLLIKKI